MKKLLPRHWVYVVLLLLVIGSYVGILVLWQHQRGEIRSLNSQMTTLEGNQEASQGPTYTDVTISPTNQAVYMPLANLKLPETNLTESLAYTYTGPYTVSGLKKIFPADLSISTHDLLSNDVSTTQQFDCAEVVYADFVTPSYPVNPMWKLDGSVKLSDGRTMNVYYATKIPGCSQSWRMNNINPKAIADSLKEANSY